MHKKEKEYIDILKEKSMLVDIIEKNSVFGRQIVLKKENYEQFGKDDEEVNKCINMLHLFYDYELYLFDSEKHKKEQNLFFNSLEKENNKKY